MKQKSRNHLYRHIIIFILIITLVSGGVLQGLTPLAYANVNHQLNQIDPLLGQWLPQPGGNGGGSPFLPAGSGMSGASLLSIPSSLPTLGNKSMVEAPPSGEGQLPEEPVLLPKGSLLIKQDDFILPSYGFPVTIQRLYQSEKKDTLSPFGYGWVFPYEHYIQMFSDFNITEFKPDGSGVTYTFQKSDPNLLVDSFDGDSLLYYPLDQGSYVSEGQAKL